MKPEPLSDAFVELSSILEKRLSSKSRVSIEILYASACGMLVCNSTFGVDVSNVDQLSDRLAKMPSNGEWLQGRIRKELGIVRETMVAQAEEFGNKIGGACCRLHYVSSLTVSIEE